MAKATTYPIASGVVQELPPQFPGTIQPSWQLGYPVRATPTAEHGMTNAGATVTTAAAKVGFVATDSVTPVAGSIVGRHPLSDPTNGRIILPVNGHNWLFIRPMVLGADGDTFPMAVWAWNAIDNKGNNNELDVLQWIPDPILHVTCTACAATGISGGRVNASWRWCDTFSAEVYRGLPTTGFITSEAGADNAPAWFAFDIGGAQYIEVEGAKNGSTRWNFLWRMI